MDNFSAHLAGLEYLEKFASTKLKNTRVIFLPPNVTSLHQPLDQGIIAAFKAHWKRYWLEFMVEKVEAGQDPVAAMDVLKAVRWALQSWHQDITWQTHEYCWLKSGLLGEAFGPPNRPKDATVALSPPLPTEYETTRTAVQSLLRVIARQTHIQTLPNVDDFISPDGERIIDEKGDLDELIIDAYDEDTLDDDDVAIDDDGPPAVTAAAAIEAYKAVIQYTEETGDYGDREWLLQLNKQLKGLKIKAIAPAVVQTSISSFFAPSHRTEPLLWPVGR